MPLSTGPMTDEQFARHCSEHPDLFFEMTAEAELIVSPPRHSFTGAQQTEVLGQLANWAVADWRLSPDFVIEVRSQTHPSSVLPAKMLEWIANGAKLAWLIDPDRQSLEIFQPGLETETLTNVDTIAADAPVEGFVLDLRPVWNPLRT